MYIIIRNGIMKGENVQYGGHESDNVKGERERENANTLSIFNSWAIIINSNAAHRRNALFKVVRRWRLCATVYLLHIDGVRLLCGGCLGYHRSQDISLDAYTLHTHTHTRRKQTTRAMQSKALTAQTTFIYKTYNITI